MDSLFSRFRQDWNGEFNLQNFTQSDWMPPIDINESGKEFLFTVELPQIDKDDIKCAASAHIGPIKRFN